jgi:hypothetical protein
MDFSGSFSIFNFGDVTKKSVFALSDASRCVFEKSGFTNFAKYFKSSSVFKISKKSSLLT